MEVVLTLTCFKVTGYKIVQVSALNSEYWYEKYKHHVWYTYVLKHSTDC